MVKKKIAIVVLAVLIAIGGVWVIGSFDSSDDVVLREGGGFVDPPFGPPFDPPGPPGEIPPGPPEGPPAGQ